MYSNASVPVSMRIAWPARPSTDAAWSMIPRRHPDGPVLGSLRGAREVERLELELGDRAQCDGDRDLERGGRRQSGADRQRRVNRPFDADWCAPEIRKLRLDRGRIPSPI